MHKALHPRDDMYSLYVSRKKKEEDTRTEVCVDASIEELKEYIKKAKKD